VLGGAFVAAGGVTQQARHSSLVGVTAFAPETPNTARFGHEGTKINIICMKNRKKNFFDRMSGGNITNALVWS